MTKLAVTKKNFDKAVIKILGRDFATVLRNPMTQLEKSISVAFIEQMEDDTKLKEYVRLMREVSLRLRKHGQFTWDKE